MKLKTIENAVKAISGAIHKGKVVTPDGKDGYMQATNIEIVGDKICIYTK